MNRYLITLPMIPIAPVVAGFLYYLLFSHSKLRKAVRVVIPVIYAMINAYFIFMDSYFGIVQFWHEEQLNTSIRYSYGMVPVTVIGIGVILGLLAALLTAPGLNFALWRRLGAPKGVSFGEFLQEMAEIKARRKPERKPLWQRIKDFLKFDDEEEDDDGVYFNIK